MVARVKNEELLAICNELLCGYKAGTYIKKFRESIKCGPEEFSARIGCAPDELDQVELGIIDPSRYFLSRLHTEFEVSIDVVLAMSEPWNRVVYQRWLREELDEARRCFDIIRHRISGYVRTQLDLREFYKWIQRAEASLTSISCFFSDDPEKDRRGRKSRAASKQN